MNMFFNSILKSNESLRRNSLKDLDINIVFDGNSLTLCQNSAAQYWPTLASGFLNNRAKSVSFNSYGIAGQTLTTMNANASTKIDVLVNQSKTNICVVWEDANDILVSGKTGQQNFINMKTYVNNRFKAGFNYVVVIGGYYPRLPYDIFTPTQSALNEQHNYFELLKNDNIFCSAYMDLRNNSLIGGGRNQNQNSTFYSDYIHLKTVGYDHIYNDFVNFIIKRLFVV